MKPITKIPDLPDHKSRAKLAWRRRKIRSKAFKAAKQAYYLEEAAKALQMAPRTLYKHIYKGSIHSIKWNGRRYVRKSEVARFKRETLKGGDNGI